MEKKVVFILTLLQLLLMITQGERILERCPLAVEMEALNLGISREDIAKWAFIADEVSSYRTEAISQPNPDGSQNYGLFQISNRFWCKSTPGIKSKNICNVDCDELVKDNIKASVDCALKIQKQEGWTPWPALTEFEPWEMITVKDCFPFETSGTNVNGTATGSGAGNVPVFIYPNIGQAVSDKDREF